MIEDEDLRKLLNEYNLKITKRRREYLKNNADYKELSQILSFIVDELNIDINVIKRHPSVLYSTIDNVKDNYKFLEDKNIYKFNLDSYINLLAIDNKEMTETYEYVLDNYEKNIINDYPKILTTSSKRISIIESAFKDKLDEESIITAAASNFTVEEIKDIINICEDLNIKISNTVFNQNANEIKKIYMVCKDNDIELRDSVFYKNAKAIKKMIEICNEQRIHIENSMFACPIKYFDRLIDSCKGKNSYYINRIFKNEEDRVRKILIICEEYDISVDLSIINTDINEISEILKICKTNHVRLCKEMFGKTKEEVLDNIMFCKEKNIKNITGHYFKRNRKDLEEVYNLCEKYGLKKEGEIFYRNKDEIEEIVNFCKDNNYNLEYSMFNHTLNEIKEIISACKRKDIPLSSEVYCTDHINLGKIVTIFKRENEKRKREKRKVIPYTPIPFLRTPTEVERILKICDKKVEIIPDIFKLIPFDVDTIIKLLETHNIQKNPNFFRIPAVELEDIINYCKENDLRINSHMLLRSKEEIEDIIDLCNDKNIEVLDYMYRRTPEELNEIIDYCQSKHIEISNNTFVKNEESTKAIIDKCEKLNIPVTGDVYMRTPLEIESITKSFNNLLSIEPISSSFSKNPKEVEEIIRLLKDENIELNELVFRKRIDELKDSIDFIKNYKKYPENDNYQNYLIPQIIIYDKDHLNRVFSYLGIRRLSYLKQDSSLLKLSIGEISEREAYIYSINERFIEDGKFNKVFYYSKDKFNEIREKESVKEDITIK